VHDPEEVYTAYEDPGHRRWQQLVLPVLKRIPLRRLHEQTDMSPSRLKAIRNGHSLPHPTHRAALIRVAGAWAREQLQRSAAPRVPSDDVEACAAHLTGHGLLMS